MKTITLILSLIVIMTSFAGCNVVAGVAYVVSPDPEQEAIFVLPQKKTVVFVDDRRNIMHPSRLKNVLADRTTADLLGHEVLANMIAPQDAMRFAASQDRSGSILTIGAIGKAVDASIVIYIEMTAFTLTVDGHNPAPIAGCSVRVVDVENRKQLFPPIDGTNAAYPVRAALHKVGSHQIKTVSASRHLASGLAQEMGDAVAKLFYKHTTGRLGENLKRK